MQDASIALDNVTTAKHKHPAAPPERIALRVHEVAAAIGLGVTVTRALIQAGDIQSIRIGRRVLVRPAAVEAFLTKQER